MAPPLSERSLHFAQNPPFVSVLGKVFSSIYHPTNNPEGYINLAVAENTLSSNMLCQIFHQISINNPLKPHHLNYTNFCGDIEFREPLVKNLFNKYIFKRDDPTDSEFSREFSNINNYFVLNGAGDVIEMLAATICDATEYIMIPSPLYLGFENDLNKRFFNNVLPVHMPYNSTTRSFDLNMDLVRRCYEENCGTKKIKGFLLCNPNNPTGDLFGASIIRQLIDFCKEKNIHFISDELYALSVFNPEASFKSAASIMTEDDRDFVHIIYSFSKDFCLNGFRVGVLFTLNKDVKAVFDTCSYFTGVSSQTQHTLAHFLKDENTLANYLKENNTSLLAQYKEMCKILDEHQVQYVDTSAGLFVWFNIERLMKQAIARKHPQIDINLTLTKEEEYEVWTDIVDHAKVNVSPGTFYKTELTGWTRVCFSAQPLSTLKIAMDRVFNYLKK